MVNTTQESEFERAFAAIVAKRVAGLLVGDDPFLQSRRDQIVQLAARHAIPAIYFSRDFSDAGGLMSYGPRSSARLMAEGKVSAYVQEV